MTIFILFIVLVISLLAFAYLWVDSFDDLEELPSQKILKELKGLENEYHYQTRTKISRRYSFNPRLFRRRTMVMMHHMGSLIILK